jgi:restriction system protein
MRENSLFAVLLRSAWWVSAVIAVVWMTLAAAFIPPKYILFGMMGATPFVVIAGMVLWRNRNAPDPQRIEAALAQAGSQPWRTFSAALDKAFAAQGYVVTQLSSEPGSHAADLRLVKNERITLVCAKRYKAASHGAEPLRELAAALEKNAAQHGVYISLGEVTEQAASVAKAHGIELVFGQRLGALLLV